MFWKYNRLAIAWALVILILCGFPGTNLPKLSFLEWLRPDKIIHLVIFGIQTILLSRGFELQSSFYTLKRSPRLWALLFSTGYGIVVEILQVYVFISRSGDVRDALANALGAIMGAWLYKRYFSPTAVS